MLHEPAAQPAKKDHAIGSKMRLGVWMFIIYAIVYVGFVAINIIKPVLMEIPILFGVNLATVYGFGLIILALILALIYNHKCNQFEKRLNPKESEGK